MICKLMEYQMYLWICYVCYMCTMEKKYRKCYIGYIVNGPNFFVQTWNGISANFAHRPEYVP